MQNALYYYKGKKECDFVLAENHLVTSLIQVTWSISDPDTRKREVEGLLEAALMTGCSDLLIVTMEEEAEIKESGYTIRIVPAWKWMLGSRS